MVNHSYLLITYLAYTEVLIWANPGKVVGENQILWVLKICLSSDILETML